ncbi:MAG: hypothetical protein PHH70_05380, partial [Candidatus Gracilibacteria bacterium]|nr:hypothetical protein [Candidatus Gracilibacteria bacterium]
FLLGLWYRCWKTTSVLLLFGVGMRGEGRDKGIQGKKIRDNSMPTLSLISGGLQILFWKKQ